MGTRRPVGMAAGLRVYAVGAWGAGGRVVLSAGRRQAEVDLPAALFDTLAVLAREALRPPAVPWAPHGYVEVARFRRELRRLTAGTPNPLDPDRLHLAKYIQRLRGHLAAALRGAGLPQARGPAGVGTPGWVKRLIENRRVLGYRLAVARRNLRLVLLDPLPASA